MSRFGGWSAFMLAIMVTCGGTASAQSFCFLPSPPTCLAFLNRDSSRSEFDLCQSTVERYRRDIADWQDCRIKEAIREASENDSKVVRRWNCLARRESICF
jgi:hypothetical protein